MSRTSQSQDTAQRMAHWDGLAARPLGRYSRHYHRQLAAIYRRLVGEGQRVLELGCGGGDLLAALRPSLGVGVDFSGEMARSAAARHPGLRFIRADAHRLPLRGPFDVIILADLVHDLWDVQSVLQEVARLSGPRTRVIINTYSRLWELPLAVTERLGLARPVLARNWLTVDDVDDLLRLTDFEVIRHWEDLLWPLPTPPWEQLCNRLLVRLFPFSQGALTNFIVARPYHPRLHQHSEPPRVSVVVPARNEAGNIPEVFTRTPEMGAGTELVLVEGGSTDDTFEAIQREAAGHPERRSVVLQQPGKGKGDAVRAGFARATGQVLMILDADLTVPPEDLPRFYEALVQGKGELINGVRLVYPMEQEAMRTFNLAGNKFFSLAFSWLLGQPVKDTLCGTKVLWRSDYQQIADNRAYFGDFDPFGDFDLLLGAARLNMKILGLPVRYRERIYGDTNISRWSHGAILLRMMLFASRRLKFV
jgi:ubiquinone/menaquinone biosynthesis C-methylase UbiE